VFTILTFFCLEWRNLTRQYSLVQIHNMPDYLVFAAMLRRLRGTSVLLDIHDTTVELYKCKWGRGPKSRIVPCVKLVERLSCAFANQITTTSPGFRQSLIRRGVPAEKVSVIINTPPQEEFPLDRDRQFKTITGGARLLYHGTVAERFGIVTAVDALKEIRKHLPDTTLSIYGKYEGPFRRRLDVYLGEMEVRNSVFLHGWHTPSEIARLMREHDVALVPHLDSEFMNLAILTKALEYAAVGMPMVLSRLEALTSLFGKDCLQYAAPGDASDLAVKVIDLCQNPDLRRAQCTCAREVLVAISPETESQKYAAAVGGLARGSHHYLTSSAYAEL
jgi:glycosyltransferase involved in cell wall biosynthesis